MRKLDLRNFNNPIIFYTSPESQEQMVEISYAAFEGVVLCRIFDKSDGSEKFQVATMTEEEINEKSYNYWQREPKTLNDWEDVEIFWRSSKD